MKYIPFDIHKNYLEKIYEQYINGTSIPNEIRLLQLKEAGFDIKEIKFAEQLETKIEEKQQKVEERFDRYGNITKNDWMPESVQSHKKDFVNWINELTFNCNLVYYKKYDIYKAQADKWLKEPSLALDASDDVSYKYKIQEIERCAENTLYYVEKYGWIKDGDAKGGRFKYKAEEHHKIILYLTDCKYCYILGKPRQIGCTTLLGLIASAYLAFRPSFDILYIGKNDVDNQKILNDKVKNAIEAMPLFMAPPRQGNWTQRKVTLRDNTAKTLEVAYPNSSIEALPPNDSATNGRAASLTMFDEIGYHDNLTKMLEEGIPMLFKKDRDGNLVLSRQMVLWGTGVADHNTEAFEREFTKYCDLWQEGLYQSALFIPIFFDYHTRCNDKFYDEQKKRSEGGTFGRKNESINVEESTTLFRMHYPASIRDMFVSVNKTLVPKEIIEEGSRRIKNLREYERPKVGRFIPVYDYNNPYHNGYDIPYKIIGAKWEDLTEGDHTLVSAWLYRHPDPNWKNRYFKGTDPIHGETGHSYFASAIFDGQDKTIACILNFRKEHDLYTSFLQSMLMSIYYDTNNPEFSKKGVPDLIESNNGTPYMKYVEERGFDKNLIFNAQLPPLLVGGRHYIGIDNHDPRSIQIINNISEVVKLYNKNINHSVVFNQLETTGYKTNSQGHLSFEPLNKHVHRDDVLYALGFAWICFKTIDKTATYTLEIMGERKIERRRITYRDANNNLLSKWEGE